MHSRGSRKAPWGVDTIKPPYPDVVLQPPLRPDSRLDAIRRFARFAEPNLENQTPRPEEGQPWDGRRRRT